MIAKHMADKVAQGVYNYMKQMLKCTGYNQGISDKLINDGITALKIVVSPDDIMSIRSMVQDKFNKNVAVTPLAELVTEMGGKVLTKKEAAVSEANRSFQGVGMAPPKMPAMMPKVAAKQETVEAQALKTLKIGFLGKSKEIKGQLSLLLATLTKACEVTKIEANFEVLKSQGKSVDEKLKENDCADLEDVMNDFILDSEDALSDIADALDTLKNAINTIDDAAAVAVSCIDEVIADL